MASLHPLVRNLSLLRTLIVPTESQSQIPGTPFGEEEMGLFLFQITALECIEEGKRPDNLLLECTFKKYPRYHISRINKKSYVPRMTFLKSIWNDPDGDNIAITEAQVRLFWNQIYALGFLNYNLPVPTEAKRSLGLHSTNPIVQENNTEDDWTEFFSSETRQEEEIFTRVQQLVLEYHAFAIKRLSSFIPVPDSIQERLSSANRLSPDSDCSMSSSNMSQVQEVAACNCPFCWLYTEDLTFFMEHLWDEHATPLEDTKDRKDSKLDDGNEEHQDSDVDMEKAAMADSQKPVATQAAAQGTKPQEIDQQDETKAQDNIDPSFWMNLLAPPVLGANHYASLNTVEHTARANLSPFLPADRVEADRSAQKVREKIETFYWFNPYPPPNDDSMRGRGRRKASSLTRKRPGMASGLDNEEKKESLPQLSARDAEDSPELPGDTESEASPTPNEETSTATHSENETATMPGSNMRPKTLSPDEDDSNFFQDYLGDRRFWICNHETDCNQQFESLVVFIEHLNTHGFVVYKRLNELHKNPPSIRELLSYGTLVQSL